MSIAFFSAGHSTYSHPARRRRRSTSSVVRSRWLIGFVAADVEDLAVARVARARPQERVRGVVDVDEVAQLRAVAVDLDRLVLDREADEPADEALAVVLDQLARAVDVRQPQRAGAHAEHVVVDEVVVLAGRLVDAVDVGRPHELALADRQRVGPAVDLARAGEDDLHVRVVVAARLENRQLAAAVDLEIRVRIAHAVDVAHLAREVEDDVAIAHEIVHRRLLADVGDVDVHAIGDAVDVEEVAAVVGDQRVDEQDVRAEIDERAREVAADEAEAAGDHHLAAAIELAVVHGYARRGPEERRARKVDMSESL